MIVAYRMANGLKRMLLCEFNSLDAISIDYHNEINYID